MVKKRRKKRKKERKKKDEEMKGERILMVTKKKTKKERKKKDEEMKGEDVDELETPSQHHRHLSPIMLMKWSHHQKTVVCI
jgi:hypothetical protein